MTSHLTSTSESGVAGCDLDLFCLPRELRDIIYKNLLTSAGPPKPSYGRGSEIDTAILRTCRTVYEEARETLYGTLHRAKMYSATDRILFGKIVTVSPPIPVLLQLRHIHFELTFSSVNRGECEVGIVNASRWHDYLLSFSLALLRSRNLASLEVCLMNTNQRKVGAKRVRSAAMLDDVKQFLLLFAYLPTSVDVSISGFDTLEYVMMFDDMRKEHAGQEVSVHDWMNRALFL